MKIPSYISKILFYIFFILIFLWILNPSSINEQLIIIIGSINIILRFYSGRFHEVFEKQKLDHYIDLVKKNLIFRTIRLEHIHFLDDNNLNLGIIQDFDNNGTSIDETFSEYVEAHLKTGYLEMKNLKDEIDECIKKHNILAQLYLEKLVEEIKNESKEKGFIESKESILGEFNRFNPTEIYQGVCFIVRSAYEKNVQIELKQLIVKKESNLYRIQYNQTIFAQSYEFEKLEKLNKLFQEILIKSLDSDDFKKLKQYHKDINDKHKRLSKDIDIITKKVNNGDYLKGNCDICPNFIEYLRNKFF